MQIKRDTTDNLEKTVELEKSEKPSLKKKYNTMKYKITDESVEDSDHFCYVQRFKSTLDGKQNWETRSFKSHRITDFFEKLKYRQFETWCDLTDEVKSTLESIHEKKDRYIFLK